jgi:hypothetical protein
MPVPVIVFLVVVVMLAGALGLAGLVYWVRVSATPHPYPTLSVEPSHRVTYWYRTVNGNLTDLKVTYSTADGSKTLQIPSIGSAWRMDLDSKPGQPQVQLAVTLTKSVPAGFRMSCGIDIDGGAAAYSTGQVCIVSAMLPAKTKGPGSAPPYAPASSASPTVSSSTPNSCQYISADELRQVITNVSSELLLPQLYGANVGSCTYTFSESNGTLGSLRYFWKPRGKDTPYPGAKRIPGLDVPAYLADLGTIGFFLAEVPGGQFLMEFSSRLLSGHLQNAAVQLLAIARPRLK